MKRLVLVSLLVLALVSTFATFAECEEHTFVVSDVNFGYEYHNREVHGLYLVKDMVCEDCGLFVQEGEYFGEEEHEEEGATCLCGMCLHTSVEYIYAPAYDDYDSKTHFTCEEYTEVCLNCGEVTGSGAHYSNVERHSYVDGICSCGKVCEHTRVNVYTCLVGEEYVDTASHELFYEDREECKKCGAELGVVNTWSILSNHYYQEDGLCSCGDHICGVITQSIEWCENFQYHDEATHSCDWIALKQCAICGNTLEKVVEVHYVPHDANCQECVHVAASEQVSTTSFIDRLMNELTSWLVRIIR